MPDYILEDLAGTNHETADQIVASFERHQPKIMGAVMTATADSERFRPTGGRAMLQLLRADFPDPV
ncbi:MAG: hypothetical protein EXR07_12795 [Acetobacteraceae bacterium]|nr:hypothetical protein [Acetobacteraceae bacterium]